MPPKKPKIKKPKKALDVLPEPNIPQVEEQQASSRAKTTGKRTAQVLIPSTEGAVPTPSERAMAGMDAPTDPSNTASEEQPLVAPIPPPPPPKAPGKRGSKKQKEQHPKPTDITHARTQLMQAILGVASSVSNHKPVPSLPPPLQTRCAARAAAQFQQPNPSPEVQQPEPVEKLQRPKPRPLPPGLRISPDSDDGFNIPKRRAKLARALDRYRAEHPPTEPVTPHSHSEVVARILEQAPPPGVAPLPTQALPKQGHVATKLPSKTTQAMSQSATVPPTIPQQPPLVVSPGGRYYSGLFPSTTSARLTGPGVLPPTAGEYTARFRDRSPVLAFENNDILTADDDSDLEPIDYSSNLQEDQIIRLCIRRGLDPRADYEKMARVYLAAKRKREAEAEVSERVDTDHDEGNAQSAGDGSSGDDHNDNGSNGEGGGGGDDDDDDDGGGSGDGGDGEDSDEEEEEVRYGPERDPWMIDNNTDNASAPCTYQFQTSHCSMRYYGPPPEFVGSNGEVEQYTTYRWNKPGASMALQRVGGGFRVPRASIWQLADARRETDRRQQEHIAAGLIQPNNGDDDDSGSDYGTTQQELKTRGRPVDSDLEHESDVDSPVKHMDKGKGHEVPTMTEDVDGGRASTSVKPERKGKQSRPPVEPSTGVGGRPSIAELAACNALGVNFHRNVTDIGILYNRRPEIILACLGLALAPTRHTSIWNAFQTLFALKAPDIPHDDEWISKCTEAYKQAMDGLTPEQKKAFECAIFEELDGIAEDPERVRTPAARMKSAIDEAHKMSSIERYSPDLVRLSVFIYTGPDPAARQMSCVVALSNILKSTLERHNIALQPLIDMASDLLRGEATLQRVEAAARQQRSSTNGPAKDIQTVWRELHEFSGKERLACYRIREEPKRALEKAEKLSSKDRAPFYRRISSTHILTEMNFFVPFCHQKRKSVPFINWATVATSWQICIHSWPDNLSYWPGCPLNVKDMTISDWQQLCMPIVEDPVHGVRIEGWTEEQKGYSPDSPEYRLIPLVKNVSGDVLLDVFDVLRFIKRPRVRSAGTRNTTAIPDDNNVEPAPPPPNTHGVDADVGDAVEEFDDIENFAEDIDNIATTDDDNGNTNAATVDFNGNVLYRIRSVTPSAAPVSEKHQRDSEQYTEEDMYELDRLDHERQRQAPISHHSPRHAVRAGKRRREDDDSNHLHQTKRKIVRIQPPPDDDMVRDCCGDVQHLEKLRNMPAPAPRRPNIQPLVFPPPSQLPMAHREGAASTAAFYKAMGGPPPSNRPLDSRPQPHRLVTQPVAAEPRRPSKPRIPAHFESDADELSIGPNQVTLPPPAARFNHQREARDGQTGPSNERFIPQGRGTGKRRDH